MNIDLGVEQCLQANAATSGLLVKQFVGDRGFQRLHAQLICLLLEVDQFALDPEIAFKDRRSIDSCERFASALWGRR